MKTLFSIILIFSVLTSTGQQLEVIGTSGTQVKNNDYQVSYTIGEMVVASGVDSTKGGATQGYQQSFIKISAMDDRTLNFEVSIYPNPTQEKITISSSKLSNISTFSLYDANGKLINSFPNSNSNKIEISLYGVPSGKYFLVASQKENNLPLTYQIIKAD